MARERRSLQDHIRGRQRSGFVGRQGQLVQYQENLGLPVDDERRRFLFNIHGVAGVGKTYLTKQLRQIVIESGGLAAYINETVDDLTSAMTVIAEEFGRRGARLVEFEKRADAYRQRRRELESDPQAPEGIAAFITKTAVTIGLSAARDVPLAGSLLAPVDAAAAAEQVNQARAYLARKFSDHDDVRLLLSPADELTPVFVAGLNRVASGRPVALFFDTYERTSPVLDRWLLGLYAGQYGDLPETLITTISGQNPLNPNLWGDYLPVIADVALEPFSEAEARQFLSSKDITDEPTIGVILTLSGRLPMWLITLAEAARRATDIGDPAGDAVERFLKWEDDPARRSIAVTAALPRFVNQDVVAAIAPADKARELFGWLRGLPFVAQRAGSWTYHEVVRAAMLRLQRAQAPREWRDNQTALAQANSQWASATAGETDQPWSNPEWFAYTREESYHLLCADPISNLDRALAMAVRAAESSPGHARQWSEMLRDAGRDMNRPAVLEWGQRLLDGIRDTDLTGYFTWLINEAHLETVFLTRALKYRGTVYQLTDRHEEALADFSRALDLEPDWAKVIRDRGTVYVLMGRNEEALADFSRALDLDPDWAKVIRDRGTVHQLMDRHEEALADFSRALDLDPDWAKVIRDRGTVYVLMDRHEEALADFSRALDLDPELAMAIVGRGVTYLQMGRNEEALADFSRGVDLGPGAVPIDETMVVLRDAAYMLVLGDFSRALEVAPEDIRVVGRRGLAQLASGRHEEALADFDRMVDLAPDDVRVVGIRDAVYQLMGRHEAAAAAASWRRRPDVASDLNVHDHHHSGLDN